MTPRLYGDFGETMEIIVTKDKAFVAMRRKKLKMKNNNVLHLISFNWITRIL